MKKGNTKNKGVNLITITLIPLISTVILYFMYITTESKIEKLFLLLIFVLTIIPFTAQLLTRILNMIIYGSVKNTKISQTQKTGYKIESNSGEVKYKSKENNNENYINLRDSIRDYSKNGSIKRNGILTFKNELDYRLGNNRYNYTGFEFKNDIHEIYTKIKSSKLTDDDYLYLKGVLEDLVGAV